MNERLSYMKHIGKYINKNRKECLFLVFLFIISFAVRSIGITWGVEGIHEYSMVFPDERGLLADTLELGRGNFVENISLKPFFYYIAFLYFGGFFVFGRITGMFSSLVDFKRQVVLDTGKFLLAGRFFTVFLASLTAVMVYYLAKKLYNRKVGYISSLFFAFSLSPVVLSKEFRLDPFLPFMFVITVFWMLKLREESTQKKSFIFVGILFGLSLATKPNALALLVPLILVVAMDRKDLHSSVLSKKLILCLGSAVLTYFVVMLPSILHYNQLSEKVHTILSQSGEFGRSPVPYIHSLPWYVTHILPKSIGFPIYLSAILGVLLGFFSREDRENSVILAVTIFAYLLPMGYFRRANFRDMFPLLPFICVSAAYAVHFIANWINKSKRKFVIAVLVALLLMPALYNIYKHKTWILHKDTRVRAKEWIEANIPHDSVIGTEPKAIPIEENLETLESVYKQRLENPVGYVEAQKIRFEYYQQIGESHPSYRIFLLTGSEGALEKADFKLRPDQLLSYLLENGIEYVILSSHYYGVYYSDGYKLHFPNGTKVARRYYNLIESNLQLIKQVIPDNRFSGIILGEPIIKIYKVPENLDISTPNIDREFIPSLNMR